jgi:predicted transposase/invertase (TIGR01784 family)
MKFLDIKTDFALKKVFGSEDSEDILIDFLNSIIRFENNHKIRNLAIVDPYNIPMLKGMKDTYVDVKAELDDNSHLIIEMQVLNHEGFEKRILYNAAKKYSAQLKKGEDYHLLNPVIALTIADFSLFPEQPDLISQYKLLEKQRLTEYSDDIELIFIELPKFTKAEHELQSIQDKWLYFIKNAGSLEFVPKNSNKEIEKAYQIANEANFSEEELELQHRKRDWVYIQKSSIELASKAGREEGLQEGLEKGIEQGMEKGVEQGRDEVTRKIVLNLTKEKVPIAVIKTVTGLTVDTIEQIQKTLN